MLAHFFKGQQASLLKTGYSNAISNELRFFFGSVEDLLIHDLYVLVALAEQQSNSERLKQGITQVLSIIDGQHQPWLNGMDLLEDAQQNKHLLSTGCERIDFLLQGGLREGHLTELVGPSSSGKTQVCLQVASNVAKEYSGSVVFFDTGNSFSPKRIEQILGQLSDHSDIEVKLLFVASSFYVYHSYVRYHVCPCNPFLKPPFNILQSNKLLEQVMNNIVCHPVFDIFTLLDVLHQLESKLRSQGGSKVRLLIVDSISSLITPILGGSGAQGHALMISAGFLLKELAHRHNLSAVVTNHMVGGEGGTLKPALGESWKSMPHVRLHLFRDSKSSICNMSILRHPYIVSSFAHMIL
ncbi:hypothetical protein RJ640_015532 [Escallonia rubra]|uniref:RecA family profile 1 domain-containing protein n=1 Tax=Escallonia rubra TaxID=112253 RepID=A0AA88UQK3_9ASTE|nr:hypothetical protein RJ640_015532 [Escallonia rubra]